MSFAIGTLRELFQHMEWADAEVWRAVSRFQAADADARLRDLLLHMHNVQRAFVGLWTGTPVERHPEGLDTLDAIRRWAQPTYPNALRFFETVELSRLEEPLVVPWIKWFEKSTGRTAETPSIDETAFQVTSHSTYHRGQINARLKELGAEPPNVDYIAWIWRGRPQAEW